MLVANFCFRSISWLKSPKGFCAVSTNVSGYLADIMSENIIAPIINDGQNSTNIA